MPVLKVYKNGKWEAIAGAASHTHTKNDITDFPTSLPANGGNADMLDGKHANEFAAASDIPTKTSQLENDSGFLTSAPVTSVNGQTGAVKITIPTVPTALKNPKALSINGTTYDGSAAVDMTENINALIDAKLSTITNAEEVAF